MDVAFSVSCRTSDDEEEPPRRIDGVTSLAVVLPDGTEVALNVDAERGLVVHLEADPDSGRFGEFEIRPGAANLFFVRAHHHEHPAPPAPAPDHVRGDA
ncbi:hypothetical protein ACN20G_33750 (plasmid) [Streptomyces sp. BI20]|uniref:hypothetical protein n=1 Tax=Streptomyces sp. BI20 TaxID=3403460 RepID=UPI003C727DB7